MTRSNHGDVIAFSETLWGLSYAFATETCDEHRRIERILGRSCDSGKPFLRSTATIADRIASFVEFLNGDAPRKG